MYLIDYLDIKYMYLWAKYYTLFLKVQETNEMNHIGVVYRCSGSKTLQLPARPGQPPGYFFF